MYQLDSAIQPLNYVVMDRGSQGILSFQKKSYCRPFLWKPVLKFTTQGLGSHPKNKNVLIKALSFVNQCVIK